MKIMYCSMAWTLAHFVLILQSHLITLMLRPLYVPDSERLECNL